MRRWPSALWTCAAAIFVLGGGALPDDRACRPEARAAARGPSAAAVTVAAIEAVGMTVSDMDRALKFYTEVLPFSIESDREVAGRSWDLLAGVFGTRARVVTLRLGEERLELTHYLAPRGRPMPPDSRGHDRWFQHVAIIVADMDAAYAHLRARDVPHASSTPQRLPDWNEGAAGIEAFYFRDPDGHFLEILEFPTGKGAAKWHAPRAPRTLFLGIDHTAIVVGSTETALAFYRDTLGLRVTGEGVNHGVEQEHLNGVFGVRLRLTTLRAPEGPAIELLEYLAPRDGRDAPRDLRANDVAHWQVTMRADGFEALLRPPAWVSLVSPDVVRLHGSSATAFSEALLVRDADGHATRLVR